MFSFKSRLVKFLQTESVRSGPQEGLTPLSTVFTIRVVEVQQTASSADPPTICHEMLTEKQTIWALAYTAQAMNSSIQNQPN